MGYSRKDFTGQILIDRVDLVPGLIIERSCFSHETPDTQVFPAGMTGVTFRGCNLDNVFIPPGNTVMPCCSTRRFKAQADGRDWIVDRKNNPIEVCNPQWFQKRGLQVPTPEDLKLVKNGS